MYFYVNMAFYPYQHFGGRKTISIISSNTEAELLNPIKCFNFKKLDTRYDRYFNSVATMPLAITPPTIHLTNSYFALLTTISTWSLEACCSLVSVFIYQIY